LTREGCGRITSSFDRDGRSTSRSIKRRNAPLRDFILIEKRGAVKKRK